MMVYIGTPELALGTENFDVAASETETLCTELITSAQDIFALAGEWQELEAHCPNSTLFQSWAWCRNFIEFASSSDANFKPLVIAIRQQARLVALLPLSIQNNNGLKVLTGFTEPYQQYTEILMSDAFEASEVAEVLIPAMEGADYFHSGQVRLNGVLAAILEGNARLVGERDAAPFVRLCKWPDFDTYYKSIKPKTRKNMRNARNRLEKSAPVTHASASKGELLDAVIDRSYEGREAWLEQLGITSRAFRNSDFREFLERFKDQQKSGIETLAMTLSHGDKPMSDQWGFVYRGRYYAFMATWHEGFEASSPGKMHLGEVIETCYERGIDVADFMIPAVSYKFTWTEDATPVCDYVMATSLRGQIQTRLWLGFLRPLAKKIVSGMPANLRGFLVKKVLPTVE